MLHWRKQPNHVSHHVPISVQKVVSNHVSHHLANHVPNDVSNQVSHHVASHKPNDVSNQVAHHVPSHVQNDVSNHVSRHVPNHVHNDISNHVSHHVPNHVSNDVSSLKIIREFNNHTERRRYPLGSSETEDEQVHLQRLSEILGPYRGMAPPSVPTKLLDHLYIGSKRDLQDIGHLKRLGITHILNCAGNKPFNSYDYSDEEGMKIYAQFNAQDNLKYNILQHFHEARAFIDHARECGGKAFVHCHMGINRSGATCIAYIMVDQDLDLFETVRRVQKKRSLILTNLSFRKQLIKFARERGLLKPRLN